MSERGLPEFPRVYAAYRGKVLAYAAKLLGRQEAEDVAQEVFVKIGRSLGSLETGSKLVPWIYAITLNTCGTMSEGGRGTPRTPATARTRHSPGSTTRVHEAPRRSRSGTR